MIDIKNMGINTESCSDVNGSQEFKCQCKEGFDGKRCEIAVCTKSYCNNNGVCSIEDHNGTKRFQCECDEGFEGPLCEIDLCDNIDCENGSCDAGRCVCNDGFIEINNLCKETCETNPCQVFIIIIHRDN